jgi:phosphoglycolate phosphatase-like HAD superfamily hydrolase
VSTVPLLFFDFDGVLMDGMPEYWWSARRACQRLDPSLVLPEAAPSAFTALRPRIHKGWEMVLVAGALARPDFSLEAWLSDYDLALASELSKSSASPEALQGALETVRDAALHEDPAAWLALHRFFPGVEQRLRQLGEEGVPWLVLTTKGGAYAKRLLEAAGLKPQAVFGHERGSKPDVLLSLRQEGQPLWFVEDRRPTLERVRATPGLESVRCFLALWGYLAPGDADGLEPLAILPLKADRFAGPLASWT